MPRIAAPTGRCIFCEQGKLSREHVWSAWLSELLPNTEGHYKIRSTSNDQGDDVVDWREDQQGRLNNFRLRVVCRTCNNGWMSAQEETSRSDITALVKASPLLLTKTIRESIRAWVGMKLIVLDRNRGQRGVFLQSERAQFFSNRILPSHLDIWLLRCGDGNWQLAFESSEASITSKTETSFVQLPNTKVWVWGIGELLILATYRRAAGIEPVLDEQNAIRIWPEASLARVWPPKFRTPAASAFEMSDVFSNLRHDERVTYDASLP